MVVREGSNVTLKCAATGSPEPTITWRRESGVPIELASGEEGKSALPMAFSIQFGLPVSPMVKCMHDSLCMYECMCVCMSMCECVLSGKYFLLLLPPAAAWGLPANILEYFYTKRQRQSDEGTDRRQTSAPPAACTTTVQVAAALLVMVRGHRRPSTCIPTSTISPVSMCCNALPPSLPASLPLARSACPSRAVFAVTGGDSAQLMAALTELAGG